MNVQSPLGEGVGLMEPYPQDLPVEQAQSEWGVVALGFPEVF